MQPHRMSQNAGMNNYPGRADFYREEENPYLSEGRGGWKRESSKTQDQVPSHQFNEGGNGGRSSYTNQKRESKEAEMHSYDQDMDIGYEENAFPPSFDYIEKKFLDEIMRLAKEQNDAEDSENNRHREKIVDINMRYQDKLLSLRSRHSNIREDFLQKESQGRMQQYQQQIGGMSHSLNNTTPTAPGLSEAYTSSGQYESFRERDQYLSRGRNPGGDDRMPFVHRGGGGGGGDRSRMHNTGMNRYF